ncbi:Palmitoyltransferase [Aphelenchoides bicaudatus]|nr:Palmitoyltransferase [Aphelenchoides bicaudatus]
MDEYTNAARIRNVDDVVKETKRYANRLQTQDIISIFYIAVVMPMCYLIETFYVLSFWHEPFSDGWLLRVVPFTYLGLNVYLNLYKLITVGPNGKAAPLPTVMKPGFRYCHSCQLNSPPRAYHCPVCDVCIYRRDHHCSFAATCVGHFNQRYFISAIANLWVLMLWCLTWNWSMLFFSLPKFGGAEAWKLMMPHVALLAGYLTFSQFLTVFFFVSSLTAWLFVTYLAAAQLFCLYRGQTRMEYLLDICAYNCGFYENVRQVLGARWPLVFVSPFISSPLLSDGVSFKAFEAADISKQTKFL